MDGLQGMLRFKPRWSGPITLISVMGQKRKQYFCVERRRCDFREEFVRALQQPRDKKKNTASPAPAAPWRPYMAAKWRRCQDEQGTGKVKNGPAALADLDGMEWGSFESQRMSEVAPFIIPPLAN